MKPLLITCLIAAISVCAPLTTQAADNPPVPAQKDKDKSAKKETRNIPFHGKIDSVDKTAKSIKVGERTFFAMAETKFTKAGKTATFDDAKAGEEVGGGYHEGDGGKLQLMSLRIGPKPEAKKKADDKK
jgi:hypothetical protein